MWRLSGVVAIVCLVLIGGISAARTFGNAQPLQSIAWFTLPNGAPCPEVCLFGMSPGSISFDEAVTFIAEHPLTRDLSPLRDTSENIRRYEGKTFDLLIGRTPGRTRLAWVSATRKDNSPSPFLLQDVTVRYGAPTYIAARSDSILVDFFFARQKLHITTIHSAVPSNAYLKLDSAVYSIFLRDSAQFEEVLINLEAGLSPWQGYTSLARYYPQGNRYTTP